jgi:hypothetical protein
MSVFHNVPGVPCGKMEHLVARPSGAKSRTRRYAWFRYSANILFSIIFYTSTSYKFEPAIAFNYYD